MSAQCRFTPAAPGNVIVEGRVKTPGFDATASARRVKIALRSRRQNASPMEPRAAHAAYDPADDRITLTCATQMPHLVRTAIADVLGIAESSLRVIAPDVGGGFGQKMSLGPEFVLVAWLARRLRASVAWSEDRRENLVACYHSRDQHVVLEGRFDDEARLVALEADIVANIGAYSCYPTTCGVEPLMAMAEFPGPYDVREYSCRARGVTTNTCPMAPYRGVSRPVITFALERLMDKAAAAFAIDPVAIRRRNLIRKFPYVSATGLTFDEASYLETMEAAVAAIDIPAFRARQAKARGRRPPPRARPRHLLRTHRLRHAGLRGARHGGDAGLGEPSTSPWTPRASSRRASALRPTARACARRSRRSSPTRSASRPTA